MSNTLTGLMPTIYAGLQVVSREMTGLIRGVTLNADVARAAKGQTIVSPVVPPMTAADLTPGVTPPNSGDQVLGNVSMSIDTVRYVDFRWNGEEQRGLNAGGPGISPILSRQFAQAFRTLGNEVELSVNNRLYKAASRAAGTPGTAPFGTAGDFSDFASAHQILDDNGAPMSDRQMALGSAAISNLRGRQSVLFKANEAGTDELLRDGIIARVEGFDLHNSFGVKPVTKGAGTGYMLGAGSYPIGATALALATGSGTVNAGDVVTLAGDANAYVVVGTGIAGPGTISIGAPGLRVAHAAGDAVTVGNSYTPNLAFSRSAAVLAVRPPAVPTGPNGEAMDGAADRQLVTDPVTGLTFDVSVWKEFYQVHFFVGLAWGSMVANPEHVAILRG